MPPLTQLSGGILEEICLHDLSGSLSSFAKPLGTLTSFAPQQHPPRSALERRPEGGPRGPALAASPRALLDQAPGSPTSRRLPSPALRPQRGASPMPPVRPADTAAARLEVSKPAGDPGRRGEGRATARGRGRLVRGSRATPGEREEPAPGAPSAGRHGSARPRRPPPPPLTRHNWRLARRNRGWAAAQSHLRSAEGRGRAGMPAPRRAEDGR